MQDLHGGPLATALAASLDKAGVGDLVEFEASGNCGYVMYIYIYTHTLNSKHMYTYVFVHAYMWVNRGAPGKSSFLGPQTSP